MKRWTLDEILALTTPEPTTGCLLWLGATGGDGYGVLRHDGRSWLAHRLVCSLVGREPTAGLVVRHRCDQRMCVRPEHLDVGTQQDNAFDRERRGRGMHTTQPHRQVSQSRHGMAKLGIYEVFLVREMWLTGEFSQRRIAAEVGVSQGHVSDIVNNKTKWSQMWNGGNK